MDTQEMNWLEYIMKLNDREINRRRASGFTAWALLGLAGLLIFQLLDNLKVIFAPGNLILFIIFTVLIANLSLSLLALVGPTALANTTKEKRLRGSIEKKSFKGIILYLIVLMLFFSLVNMYLGYKLPDNIHKWPYYVFGFIYLLQALGNWIQKMIWTKKFYFKSMDIPEISSNIYPSEKIKKYLVPIVTIAGIGLLSITIYCIRDLSLLDYIIPNVAIIKTSLNLFLLLIVFLLIISSYANRIRYGWLEDLERRIVVENLKADQIQSLFVKEFLGEKTLDWISSIQSELNNHVGNVLKTLKESEQEMEEIKKIDKEFSYEIEGRVKDLCKKLADASTPYFNYSKNKLDQIKIIQNQYGFAGREESIALTAIISEWEKIEGDLKNKEEQYFTACKAFSCGKK